VGFIIVGRVGLNIAKQFVPHQPAAQNIATPIVGVLTLVVMEMVAYNLEKGYNKNGSAVGTYRILGIPNLRLSHDTAGMVVHEKTL
jgi:hypothetical protein